MNAHYVSISDYAKGFGGHYGVEVDRMDTVHFGDITFFCCCKSNVQFNGFEIMSNVFPTQSAASFNEMEPPSSSYEKPKAFEPCECL